MFYKPETYRDKKPYRFLEGVRKLFFSAHDEFDFKSIGKKNDIVNTVWTLIMLSFRLNYICESILSCKNYYTVAIIYRALIEYSVKHMYFFMHCIKNGGDIANEYVSPDHMSHEQLQKIRKAQWPLPLKLSQEQRGLKKRLDKIAEKFKFSEVSKSILEMSPNDKTKEALRDSMVQYSFLSSYVHGGPIAVLDLEEKNRENIDMSSVLTTIIAYNNIIKLLSSYPSEHQNELNALDKEMSKKVNEALTYYEGFGREVDKDGEPAEPEREKEVINEVVKKIIKKLKVKGQSQVIGCKSEGYKRERYNKFDYVRETDNAVILLREKGTEARIPYSKIAQAIEAVRTNPEIYTQGPSSLRKYGITYINSPVWSLLHLLSIDELAETTDSKD